MQSDNGPVTEPDIADAQQKLRAVKGVAAVGPALQRSRDGRIAKLDLILQGDPANKSALDIVPRMRDAVLIDF